MKKKVQLTPELNAKYRAWLAAQKAQGLTYSTDESAPLVSEPDNASVEKWMRDANIASVKFEDDDNGDEEERATTAPIVQKAPQMRVQSSSTIIVAGAVGGVALLLLVVYCDALTRA
jgi:hypothetical protein